MKIPKAETLILVAFLICTALWAVSKCSARRSDAVRQVRQTQDTEGEDRPMRHDTVVKVIHQPPQPPPQTAPQSVAAPVAAPTPVNTQHPGPPPVTTSSQSAAPLTQPGSKPPRPTISNQTAKPAPSTSNSGTTLYVTIDGLKVRKEPGLKGETVESLKLYDPVTFLNKKTDWTQEISLGYEKVTDHWVKVRTKSGKEGWVFGAGVHYYKMKRKGVMD